MLFLEISFDHIFMCSRGKCFESKWNTCYQKNYFSELGFMRKHLHLIVYFSVAKDYVRLMKYADSLYRCKQLKKAALGRYCKNIDEKVNLENMYWKKKYVELRIYLAFSYKPVSLRKGFPLTVIVDIISVIGFVWLKDYKLNTTWLFQRFILRITSKH